MDKIIIRDLPVSTIIGTLEQERLRPQKVFLNLTVFTDMTQAGISDDFHDALDYSALEHAVFQTVSEARDLLLERLAQRVADRCLEFPAARSVRVVIDKPGAARHARSIAVEIERSKA